MCVCVCIYVHEPVDKINGNDQLQIIFRCIAELLRSFSSHLLLATLAVRSALRSHLDYSMELMLTHPSNFREHMTL